MRGGRYGFFPALALLAACGSPSRETADSGAASVRSVYTDAVRIIVEPSDDASALVSAISSATTSVHMTMYLLDNVAVMRALEAQRSAGLDVRVVLNESFPGGTGSNANAYDELASFGIAVEWAPPSFALTHEKCVILDGREAWIMTMNLDESSALDNREYLAVDADPADVSEAETIFEADFAHVPAKVSGRLVVSPVNARPKLVALLAAARRSVELEGEELSDGEVVSALRAAAGEGVAVRVVLSNDAPSAEQEQAVSLLTAASVAVVRVSRPYIHAKAIVVDGSVAYVGSENFSAASLDDNRELGLLFDAKGEVQKVDTTILADFAIGTPE